MPDGPEQDHVVAVPVDLPQAVTGTVIRVTVTAVRQQTTLDFYQGAPIEMPVGIAELGIAGLQVAPLPAEPRGRAGPTC